MRHKLLRLTMIGLLGFSCAWGKTPDSPTVDTIAQGLPKLLASSNNVDLKHVNIGIVVQSLKSGKVLYQKNANHLYTPASVMKLFTAIAALDYLKPNFVFKTKLFTTGSVKQNTLHGNLYIQFSGDPTLKISDLKTLLHQVRHSGIQRIHGKVIIDNTAYNSVPYPPGWIWDDLSYSYAAPISAVILNENKFALHFKPADKVGKRPSVWSDLPAGVITINNRAITTYKHKKYCPLAIYSDMQNHYTVRGCLDIRSEVQHRTLALRRVMPYAQALVKNILDKQTIPFSGSVAVAKTPATAKLFAEHDAKPLSKIVHQMLKESDNLMTNAIFKKLGEMYYNTTGTWQNSLLALRHILEPTHINFKQCLIADGAGLSRYNLITPNQFAKLLYFAYHHSRVRDPLISALPVAGKDGTLIGRMLSMGKGGRIHAKTGTMTGVTSLAGFINTKYNGPVAFVIMVNGFVKPRRPYIQLQDTICKFLVNARGEDFSAPLKAQTSHNKT